MDKSKEKALDNFVDQPEDKKTDEAKKVLLNKKEGLIERVDKVFITEDGRQLLREHY